MYTLIFLLYSLTFYSDEGSGMCPHGGHAASAYSSAGDKGLGVDPNG